MPVSRDLLLGRMREKMRCGLSGRKAPDLADWMPADAFWRDDEFVVEWIHFRERALRSVLLRGQSLRSVGDGRSTGFSVSVTPTSALEAACYARDHPCQPSRLHLPYVALRLDAYLAPAWRARGLGRRRGSEPDRRCAARALGQSFAERGRAASVARLPPRPCSAGRSGRANPLLRKARQLARALSAADPPGLPYSPVDLRLSRAGRGAGFAHTPAGPACRAGPSAWVFRAAAEPAAREDMPPRFSPKSARLQCAWPTLALCFVNYCELADGMDAILDHFGVVPSDAERQWMAGGVSAGRQAPAFCFRAGWRRKES